MTRNIFYIFICCIAIISCKSPEARRPIQRASGSFINKSVERNKKVYELEKARILDIIQENPQRTYLTSESGFWYYYNTKKSLNNPNASEPKYGDNVTFTYNIKDLNEISVLTENEIGTQNYIIDQTHQELISGLRDGIKLMKEGETITFLFPSYKAFGYYGIENKLGANIPIQSTVTLKSINQNQENY